MANAKTQRIYLTAVTIQSGIIQVIQEGRIVYYRQRGIQKIPADDRKKLIELGFLNPGWANIPELPSYITVEFEDPVIQGRARMSFPTLETIQKVLLQSKKG